MAGLQRSVQTFRRSGSSGLVWDERFLTEDAGDGGVEGPRPELRHSRSVGSIGMLRRSGGGGEEDSKKARKLKLKQKNQKKEQEEGGGNGQVFRTRDVAPAADPPSPRVSGCNLCAVFRSPGRAAARRAKARKQ